MGDLQDMTDWDKLKGMLDEEPLEDNTTVIDEGEMRTHLLSRVKGQDHVIADITRLIRLSWMKEERQTPVANLLFLGPTGTGKTELAKAMCEFLYGDEEHILRFDCSELSSPDMAKSRLTGASAGFKDAESGGQLTRPMFANPKRVVLFDEIEKAHPLVFDLFLQMMGEGRLTEQSTGKTANFTKSIIVLTSNSHAEELTKIAGGIENYHDMLNAIKGYLAEAQIFRPEILGRIDKVYLFKPLEGIVIAEIALLKIAKLGKEYNLKVKFVAPELLVRALEANVKVSRFGIRELERIIFDLFANYMVEARGQKAKMVSFSVDKKGEIACEFIKDPPKAPPQAAPAPETAPPRKPAPKKPVVPPQPPGLASQQKPRPFPQPPGSGPPPEDGPPKKRPDK